MTRAQPSEVARLFGAQPASVRLVQDSASTHWIIRDEDGTYVVLRRCAAAQTAASLDYEIAVLEHLHARGWPVAPPLAAPVEVGGRWWALYPRLSGRRKEWPRDDPRHRWRGELLARLHADTAELRRLGQRDDYHRADEDAEVTPEHTASLARLHALDPVLAVAFERQARQIAEGVSFLGAGSLPSTVIHGDFLPWNLRVRGMTLVGLLDFEACRLDARATDVAMATWGGRYPGVLDGYNEVSPLAEDEEAALALLWRALWLSWGWRLVARTRDRVEPGLDAVLEKLARPWGA